MEKHGTTVYLPPRDMAVDAVLYGPDLEAHYFACIREIAADWSIENLRARPDLLAELNRYWDCIRIVRVEKKAAEGEAAQRPAWAASAGLPVLPGKSAMDALNSPFVRVSASE